MFFMFVFEKFLVDFQAIKLWPWKAYWCFYLESGELLFVPFCFEEFFVPVSLAYASGKKIFSFIVKKPLCINHEVDLAWSCG